MKKKKILFYIKNDVTGEYFCEFKSGNYKITDVGEAYKKHSSAMKHYNFWKSILNHDVVEFILKDETIKKQITKK